MDGRDLVIIKFFIVVEIICKDNSVYLLCRVSVDLYGIYLSIIHISKLSVCPYNIQPIHWYPSINPSRYLCIYLSLYQFQCGPQMAHHTFTFSFSMKRAVLNLMLTLLVEMQEITGGANTSSLPPLPVTSIVETNMPSDFVHCQATVPESTFCKVHSKIGV